MKIQKIVVGDLKANCYIVSSSAGNAFVIDPGDEPDKITGFLKANKLTACFAVVTHGHIDHFKGAAGMALPVYIHQEDAGMISDPGKNHMTSFFGSFDPVEPQRLLKDGDEIILDELKFKVIHTPGHTHGCICLYGEGILFSGDTLFWGGVGRTDFEGASYQILQESLKKLSLLDASVVVYPGHGPQTTIGRELRGI
jgi:hydroxyacylglutathione hydrolase